MIVLEEKASGRGSVFSDIIIKFQNCYVHYISNKNGASNPFSKQSFGGDGNSSDILKPPGLCLESKVSIIFDKISNCRFGAKHGELPFLR